jgi:hypothetical protein
MKWGGLTIRTNSQPAAGDNELEHLKEPVNVLGATSGGSWLGFEILKGLRCVTSDYVCFWVSCEIGLHRLHRKLGRLKTVRFHTAKSFKIRGLAGKVTAYPARRPLETWTRLQRPDGPMAQDFEPVRRSRASMTVGQTSIS